MKNLMSSQVKSEYLSQLSEISHSLFDSLSSRNKPQPTILCWIMTGPSNHQTKAVHVKHTWGSHCDKLMFMSTEEDKELGSIKLDVEEGRQGLWGKTKLAFKYVYENHYDEYDWFMKADDDTFVIIENLKYLLSNYNTTDPLSFGHHFKVLGVSKRKL